MRRHLIHRADRRLAEIRAGALRALLVVAAAPMLGTVIALLSLAVRP